MDHLLNLKVFTRLMELRSFSRVAAQLGMAPATVTTHLAQLESHLGVKLINRNTRKLSITDEGEFLYEAAAFILQEFQQLEDRFVRTAIAMRGRLRITVPPIIAAQILLPALPGFLERYPDVQMEIGVNTRYLDLVQEGIDCAVRVGTLPDSALISRPLGFYKMVTVASPDYLARHGEPASLNELSQHACIGNLSPSTGRVREWVFEKNHNRETLHVPGALTLGSVEACVQAAALGLGVTQVVSLAAHDLIQTARIREILADWAAVGPPVQIVYERSRMANVRLKAFVEFAMETFPKYLLPCGPGEKGARPRAQRKVLQVQAIGRHVTKAG